MPSLTDLIQTIVDEGVEDDLEDIFAAAPGLIFPDDLRNNHGDERSTMIYKSRRFGDIELRTADPEAENERQLFSHYLWNAGIKMAELISNDEAEAGKWSVKDETVLELGAGVGLDGIVATLAGTREVVISDYPAPVVLANIERNAAKAIPQQLETKICRTEGHQWGNFDTDFAKENQHHFTRVLAADCYWMPGQHENLARSMLHFLHSDITSTVFVIAGFHTGRAKLANFFDVAVEEGLEVVEIYEEDAEGRRREWLKERDGGREDHTERKKWLVIARLRRRIDQK
ncbi:hypothetical protein EJ03DRAFT_275699 [Teratosphaeria nubilosa]|uniref:Nicotinamide N-methyltransferase n=1 Tax=Teratosphaeria nubilosa TaxID=161662 RepID=A0A6G1L516_9PEZI|nr:hypothetical protein EJ03DRAFT_275699 [Teratosphaeria nubilosa]